MNIKDINKAIAKEKAKLKRIYELQELEKAKQANAAQMVNPDDSEAGMFLKGGDIKRAVGYASMLTDNIANAQITKNTANREVPVPNMRKALPLETNININPQLANIDNEYASLNSSLDNAFVNPNIGAITKLGATASKVREKNKAYSTKELGELDLRNKNIANTQQVSNANLGLVDNYNQQRLQRADDIDSMRSANFANLGEDIQQTITEENRRGLDKARMVMDASKYNSGITIDSYRALPQEFKTPDMLMQAANSVATNSMTQDAMAIINNEEEAALIKKQNPQLYNKLVQVATGYKFDENLPNDAREEAAKLKINTPDNTGQTFATPNMFGQESQEPIEAFTLNETEQRLKKRNNVSDNPNLPNQNLVFPDTETSNVDGTNYSYSDLVSTVSNAKTKQEAIQLLNSPLYQTVLKRSPQLLKKLQDLAK